MLPTRADVECAGLERFIGLRLFNADFCEFRELRGVLGCKSRRHVLHEDDRSREVAREAGRDAHNGCRSACRRSKNDNRETLVKTRTGRWARGDWRGWSSRLWAAFSLNRGSEA